jgi:hypothetical protein
MSASRRPDGPSSAAKGMSSNVTCAPHADAATSHTLRRLPVESMYSGLPMCSLKSNCSTSMASVCSFQAGKSARRAASHCRPVSGSSSGLAGLAQNKV